MSKIAAGEVVERPASVVKELLENSLDAGASNIDIEILGGGSDLIRVSDDGSGMNRADLELATTLHATSKLTSITDLNKLLSFGFRGEALASIAAAADVEILTAHEDGSAWRYTDSEETKIVGASRAQGTTVTMKSLFRKLPARRKFLKSERTEELAIKKLVAEFALAHPEVEFSLVSNEAEKLRFDRLQNLVERMQVIFKLKDRKKIIEILPETTTKSSNSAKSISGGVLHPTLASKRPLQIVAVNSRVVNNNTVRTAVKRAFAEKIPRDLAPGFFLDLKIPREEVDVNIHPRKEEVKFADNKAVFKLVFAAVTESLSKSLDTEFAERFEGVEPEHERQEQQGLQGRKELLEQNLIPAAPRSTSTYSSPTTKLSYSPKPQVNQALSFSAKLLSDSKPLPQLQSELEQNRSYGQIFSTYITFTRGEQLVFIDQHAAAERVNYEKFKLQYSGSTEGDKGFTRSPLLVPELVTLSSEIPPEKLANLEKLGFELQQVSSNRKQVEYALKSIPEIALKFKAKYTTLLKDFVAAVSAESLEDEFPDLEQQLDLIIATLACHASIRAGEELTQMQIQQLVSDLADCESPHTCPHGRPITWELSKSELEVNFLRKK